MEFVCKTVEAAASVVPYVSGAVQTTLFLTKELHRRIVGLQLGEKLRNTLCSRVKELQSILQKAQMIVTDTSDEFTSRTLDSIEQELNKCLTECARMERRSLLGKFRNVTSDSNEVKELDRLLNHSLQIATALLTVSNYSARERDSRYHEKVTRNPQAGFYPVSAGSKPGRVEKPLVKEDSPGVLHVCWRSVTDAEYYEVEYDQQNGQHFKEKSTKCSLHKAHIRFPSKFDYDIRVRGVNEKGGPGEWSESTVGKFTILPQQPRKPLAIHANSSTSVTLVVEKPAEEEEVKPVTHFVVEYYKDEETEWTKKVFAISELEAMTLQERCVLKINLDWCVDTAHTYCVRVCVRNEDGQSLPSQQDRCKTNQIPPGEPVGLTVVYEDTSNILIEWNKPEASLYVLDHYELQWGRRNMLTKESKTTKKCYAWFRKLQTITRYLFKVRAVRKNGCVSKFVEVSAETNSMAGKVAMVAGAGVGSGAASAAALVAYPVTISVLMGTGAGLAAAVSVKDKGKGAEVAAGTAAGIAGGIAGFGLGLLLAPLAIVSAPFALVVAPAIICPAVAHDDLHAHLEKYPDDDNITLD